METQGWSCRVLLAPFTPGFQSLGRNCSQSLAPKTPWVLYELHAVSAARGPGQECLWEFPGIWPELSWWDGNRDSKILFRSSSWFNRSILPCCPCPIVLGGGLDDTHIAYIARHLGFSSVTLHKFFQQLQEPSAQEAAGAPAHVQRFMQALHTDTWFRWPKRCCAHWTRPGDSYADVVFGLPWAKLLRTYETRLVEADVLTTIPNYEYPGLFECQHAGFVSQSPNPVEEATGFLFNASAK